MSSKSTTLPAGQIGVISFGSSGNGFDDFKAHDLAGPYEVDGRYFAEVGDVQVDSGSYADVLSINNTAAQPVPVVRRGFRCETFVSTFKFKWTTPCRPGLVFGYLDPSNWWAVEIRSTDGKARLIQRTDDGPVTVLATDTTALSLTNNTWYTAKVVVDWHPTFTTSTYVQMWADTDNDGDFSDETGLLGQFVTGAVGYVGVYRGAEGSTVQQFDDFKLGTDNSSPKDGDFADGGDEIAIDDNFNSAAITLTYDNNGNLTDDGIFAFVYDAWNRLVMAKHRSASNAATVGTYAYDGNRRRISRVIANSGPEATLGDEGNRTSHYYAERHGARIEERNGSTQVVREYANGTHERGEVQWIEINGDCTISNDTNPDLTATGEATESPVDRREYAFATQLRRITTITGYDPAGAVSGHITSRTIAEANSDANIVLGDLGNGELARVLMTSQYYDDAWRPRGGAPDPHSAIPEPGNQQQCCRCERRRGQRGGVISLGDCQTATYCSAARCCFGVCWTNTIAGGSRSQCFGVSNCCVEGLSIEVRVDCEAFCDAVDNPLSPPPPGIFEVRINMLFADCPCACCDCDCGAIVRSL